MPRSALLVLLLTSCTGAVGGPIDRRYPPDERRVHEAGAGARRVEVITRIAGVHHAGQSAGCSTRSEVGWSLEGAAAGDRFAVELYARVPGATLLVGDKPEPAGTLLRSRDRLASRAEADKVAGEARVESCAGAGGDRVALRATLGEVGADFTVFDFAATPPRWGVVSAADCPGATGQQPMVWNAVAPSR